MRVSLRRDYYCPFFPHTWAPCPSFFSSSTWLCSKWRFAVDDSCIFHETCQKCMNESKGIVWLYVSLVRCRCAFMKPHSQLTTGAAQRSLSATLQNSMITRKSTWQRKKKKRYWFLMIMSATVSRSLREFIRRCIAYQPPASWSQWWWRWSKAPSKSKCI